MKTSRSILLLVAILLVISFSAVGAQDDNSSTCGDSSCNPELARLCASFMAHWEAAGGESSGLTIPDWCNESSQSTPQDTNENACDGGLLDGRCGSEWEWTCGWYLQQWEDAGGWKGTYEIPDWCNPQSVLPPKPSDEQSATTTTTTVTTIAQAGCFPWFKGYYMKTNGSAVEASAAAYYDNTCSITIAGYDSIAWAATKTEADALCLTISPTYTAATTPTTNLWDCR
ncbi:MAG: hypothetical protein R3E39_08445 [Anaerolineae bacterium]